MLNQVTKMFSFSHRQIVDIDGLLTIISFFSGYVCRAVPRIPDVPLGGYRGGKGPLATGTGFVWRLLRTASFLVPLKIRASIRLVRTIGAVVFSL